MPSLAATSTDVPSFAHNHRHCYDVFNILVGMDLWNPSAGIRNMKMQPYQTVATPMQADQWVQTNCEELQARVEALNSENHSLRDELQRLSDECGKLTSENNSIKDELTRSTSIFESSEADYKASLPYLGSVSFAEFSIRFDQYHRIGLRHLSIYMTILAIEQGILGIYDAKFECDFDNGSRTLCKFVLTLTIFGESARRKAQKQESLFEGRTKDRNKDED
ncbi:G-box-binding factor 1-like protein isoform X1 [Tanacetum coccineum]